MFSLEEELQRRLAADAARYLHRELQVVPKGMVAFADNDYLGLATHPKVVQAALQALQRSGRVGGGAARLISGHFPEHQELEERLAQFKGAATALLFSSGYAVPCGVIPALLGPNDYVVMDRLSHASLLDGAKLSAAKRVVFRHNDAGHLAEILGEIRRRNGQAKILIVVESVYSMDGDCAPLVDICSLKERFGAWLMVDEAHATGVFGRHGEGLCGQLGVSARVEVQMGTLGKALGVSGGYVVCTPTLRQYLLQHARSFIFTTATAPCLAAALSASLAIVAGAEGEELRQRLWGNIERLHQLSGGSTNRDSAIVPILLGDEAAALAASTQLRESHIYVPSVRYPTVARGQARLRVALSARHTEEQIALLAKQLALLSA